jgi:hypothetical protein
VTLAARIACRRRCHRILSGLAAESDRKERGACWAINLPWPYEKSGDE